MPYRRMGGVKVLLHSFLFSILMAMSGQLHTLASLPTATEPMSWRGAPEKKISSPPLPNSKVVELITFTVTALSTCQLF
jgi:hypothetical protein